MKGVKVVQLADVKIGEHSVSIRVFLAAGRNILDRLRFAHYDFHHRLDADSQVFNALDSGEETDTF
jgi:hypothetical protein